MGLDFNCLEVAGIVAILICAIMICIFLWEFISDTIEDFKWAYKRKHRFDKPPTAACYCRDCKYYAKVRDFGKCHRGHIESSWNIADSWFCWQAESLKKDPEKKGKKKK